MNNITERSLFLTVTFFVVKKIICKIIIYAKPSCLLHSMRFKISKYKIISLKFTLYCLERLGELETDRACILHDEIIRKMGDSQSFYAS